MDLRLKNGRVGVPSIGWCQGGVCVAFGYACNPECTIPSPTIKHQVLYRIVQQLHTTHRFGREAFKMRVFQLKSVLPSLRPNYLELRPFRPFFGFVIENGYRQTIYSSFHQSDDSTIRCESRFNRFFTQFLANYEVIGGLVARICRSHH